MSNHTAVIGQPIEHSISPKIHNFWIKENGIEVGEYKKISVNLPQNIMDPANSY